MEETNGKEEDLQGNFVWQTSARASLKHTASGRSTPRNSPRRLRASQREFRGGHWRSQWFGLNRLVLWLALIGVWAYVGFHVQSRWADNDGNVQGFVGYRSDALRVQEASDSRRKLDGHRVVTEDFEDPGLKRGGVSLARDARVRPEISVVDNGTRHVDDKIAKNNTSYGLLVGPFGRIEDRILGWPAEKRKGPCERNSSFAELVSRRKFVLIFHELSMTGAPISMMELATEILNCGGSVSAVVLNRKGGLMTELRRRGIKVVRDKGRSSFRAANRADLIVAGSAVCALWIEDYLSHFPSRSNRVLWWIMENRREYFDRSKLVLDRVKLLMFLAESQSKQWLTWCKEEGIHLKTAPTIVPLSVNDELAFVAGIPCPLNNPSFSVEKMQEKRNLLRLAVRREMGLTDNDMLVMSLSSINPGKGQYYLLESLQMFEEIHSASDIMLDSFVDEKNKSDVIRQESKLQVYPRTLLKQAGHVMNVLEDDLTRIDNIDIGHGQRKQPNTDNQLSFNNVMGPGTQEDARTMRNLLSEYEVGKQSDLKLVIGSVRSKSNKVHYIKEMLNFLSRHPHLSRSLIWTPATTRVSSLYAAADVYVINAQGSGETFGRVTIEAMAFGLPVLGTDAGGTKEIAEDKMTALLHPVGRQGVPVLAQNLHFLLRNASAREQLGRNGRSKVENMYMKHHMYDKLSVVFAECMM